ncbi:hypothetical protein AACH06_29645 [Ideonella sp. DXS29W]|uniref:Uncharacterized protein n=1 Tax=Ideonella lacteola TaxID=2984193 RepID=A0ABU9C2C0_9BURK
MKQIEKLEIVNPNHAWVMAEFELLYAEWKEWELSVAQIVDQPYDTSSQAEVYADGEDNMHKHAVLQAKTLTFLNNNIKGHGFIEGFDGKAIDRRDLRLKIRVKHRLQQLEMLRASLKYAKVPEAYWKQKGKELLESVAKKTGDSAIEVAASYLKNPFSSGTTKE